jgi:DnaJ-class molecular chaperone
MEDDICPTCFGEGKTYESDISDEDGISVVGKWFPCDRCKGTGKV